MELKIDILVVRNPVRGNIMYEIRFFNEIVCQAFRVSVVEWRTSEIEQQSKNIGKT